MKKLYIFLIVTVLFASIDSYSQDRRNRRQNENSDKKGKVSGKVIDETGNSPIESATVQLLRARDSSVVTGASTGKDGKFVLEAPFGRFKLRISFIGYNNAVINNISIRFFSNLFNLILNLLIDFKYLTLFSFILTQS